MKFVHLIEINAADNPLIDPLSRDQLWRGLVLRAERPTLFVLALDACEITNRSENGISRTLQFGKLVIRDEVRFNGVDELRMQLERDRIEALKYLSV
jgi:hypothetical protein